MKTLWNKGLNPQEKLEMRQEYIQAAPTRKRLKELLTEKIESARSASRGSSTYESPSWALMQADSIGYERALFEVISIISEEKVQKDSKSQ